MDYREIWWARTSVRHRVHAASRRLLPRISPQRSGYQCVNWAATTGREQPFEPVARFMIDGTVHSGMFILIRAGRK